MSTPYHLHGSLGYQMTVAARIQEKRLEDRLKTLGLTRITWCILLAAGTEGLAHPSAIASFVGIDRTAISRALRQMEDDGLIRRKAGKTDRRTTLVEVTETGAARVEQAIPVAQENSRLVEAKLTPGEVADFRRILCKLREGEELSLKTF